jgi:hypothetical protein
MQQSEDDRAPTQILNMHKIGRKIPEGCVYVGRPSAWGNPYSHVPGSYSVLVASRDEAVEKFRGFAKARAEADPTWLRPLRGATALVCWCSPLPCHAEILVRLMSEDSPVR